MSAGYLGGDCVLAEIQASVDNGVDFARSQISSGESELYCLDEDCGEEIPLKRRETVKGCKYCVKCQAKRDKKQASQFNRRGSKDSQIR